MIERRAFLTTAATIAATASSPAWHIAPLQAETMNPMTSSEISVSLNTSTVRGHKLSVPDQIRITAEAGYDGIEPWIRDLRNHIDQGGKAEDLRKQIEDSGLRVVSAIGFANWIVDDPASRQAGLDEARRDMELVRMIGGDHLAAPPIGAHKPGTDSPTLPQIADRYRALCEIGEKMQVFPQLELWGFSPTLSKIAEMAYVASAAAHPMACVLPDFYHIYKGGNDFESLKMIEASKMHVFHINDYPNNIPLSDIADKDRVFPGDGDCDLPKIIRSLIDNGFRGTFSLELFNPHYWQRDSSKVVTEGLRKTRSVLEAALA